MRHLLQIALDNSVRLLGRVHYFSYKGVRFKLVQNDPRAWSDALLTVLDRPDEATQQAVYDVAGEFVSALNWRLDFSMALRPVGLMSVHAGFTLRRARCTVWVWPEIPFSGNMSGHDVSAIAKVDTAVQRRALTLYREAQSANKDLLAFLLNWQVLEIPTGKAVPWVDGVVAAHPPELFSLWKRIGELGLGSRALSDYLLEDCRHAIAHLQRTPGKRVLRFDDRAEREKLHTSVKIIRDLARFYIKTELGVTDLLWLTRKHGRGFPTYRSEAELRTGHYTLVRPKASASLFPKIKYKGPRRPR